MSCAPTPTVPTTEDAAPRPRRLGRPERPARLAARAVRRCLTQRATCERFAACVVAAAAAPHSPPDAWTPSAAPTATASTTTTHSRPGMLTGARSWRTIRRTG
jgi:hypothetical protein